MTDQREMVVMENNRPTLTATDVRKQVNLIQEVMKAVMVGPTKKDGKDVPGVHYGIIPGCKLPSLYKAGAEKLAMTFKLGAEYEELPGSTETDSFICYKINCKLFHIPSGNIIGHGRGTCNSKEKKYRTRMVYADKATEEEKNIGREEERTGAKGKYKVIIVPQDPWDIQNTIYKIGCKRAMVAAIINATGASDIFTQDIEDLPEGTVVEDAETVQSGKPEVSEPKEKELTYVDIITLKQASVGTTLDVCGYGVSIKHRTVGTKKSDITDFSIGDLPSNPTLTIEISAWGKLDAGAAQVIKFKGVKVGEYKGKTTYLATEVIC